MIFAARLLSVLLVTNLPRLDGEYYPVTGSDFETNGTITAVMGSIYILENGTNRVDIYGGEAFKAKAGDVVSIRGRLNKRQIGAPSRVATALRVIRHGPPPAVRKTTLSELIRKKSYLLPLRIRATVDDIAPDDTDPRYLQITLRAEGDTVIMSILRQIARDIKYFDSMLYSEIEVSGVCFPELPTIRFFKDPIFIPFGASSVRVVNPSSTEIYNCPTLTDQLPTSPSEISALGLRTLRGTVLATWNDKNVILQSNRPAEADLVTCHRIELAEGSTLPHPGDAIQVVGRPATDLYRINLSTALWRPTDTFGWTPLDTLDTSIDKIVNDSNGLSYYLPAYFGREVRMKGRILSLPQAGAANRRLYLTDRGNDFALDVSSCPNAIKNLSTGCLLSVKGICLLESENWRPNAPLPVIRGVTIILRASHDITVLARPPWWTVGRLAILVASLLTILAGVLVWNRILNRLIVRRSRELLREQSARNASELRIGERTRLAVELHDTLSQNLVGVACQVASAKNAIGTDDEVSRRRLFTAERMLKSCRTELRQVLSDLRNDALECPTIEEALRSVLEPTIGEAELSIRFNVPRVRLQDSTVYAILCIVRELVGNAIRHGGATILRVAGALEKNRIVFSVQENGTGFDLKTCAGPAQGHFGLDGIRNRISRFGGTFQIETASGKGSNAVIGIPLPGRGEHKKADK